MDTEVSLSPEEKQLNDLRDRLNGLKFMLVLGVDKNGEFVMHVGNSNHAVGMVELLGLLEFAKNTLDIRQENTVELSKQVAMLSHSLTMLQNSVKELTQKVDSNSASKQ